MLYQIRALSDRDKVGLLAFNCLSTWAFVVQGLLRAPPSGGFGKFTFPGQRSRLGSKYGIIVKVIVVLKQLAWPFKVSVPEKTKCAENCSRLKGTL